MTEQEFFNLTAFQIEHNIPAMGGDNPYLYSLSVRTVGRAAEYEIESWRYALVYGLRHRNLSTVAIARERINTWQYILHRKDIYHV